MARLGIDYAFSKPTPAAIRAAGYTFACRYLGGSKSKDLTRSEAAALRAAGVDVVANWEAAAGAAKNGRAQGVSDAREALAQANAAGIPAGRPIYFSVDFDVTASQMASVTAYFDGVASVLGLARTGAYGGYSAVKHLLDAGKVRWAWQTYAWSGGKWDSRAQLRQVKNGITVGGADCDRDEAMAEDFGQWGYQGADLTPQESATLANIWNVLRDTVLGVSGPVGDTKANNQVPLWVKSISGDVQAIKAAQGAPAPVAVDAAAVAAALAANTDFAKAVAKAVNDDAAARMAS